MARIYIEDIDVLIIDEIGKEISGAGADPNVIGSTGRAQEGFELPRVKKIVMLDLTDATKGNAAGVGSADVITSRLYRRIDFGRDLRQHRHQHYLSGRRDTIPMRTEGEAVRLAVKTLIGIEPKDARIVRIRNTLALGERSAFPRRCSTRSARMAAWNSRANRRRSRSTSPGRPEGRRPGLGVYSLRSPSCAGFDALAFARMEARDDGVERACRRDLWPRGCYGARRAYLRTP